MRALALAALIAFPGCQSLSTVEKSPDRSAVAEILVKALACKDVDGEDPRCKAEEKPVKVQLTDFDCASLPLRSAVRELAHARCEWDGAVIQANGEEVAVSRRAGAFSLIDLTPGAYRPTREWVLDRLE